MAKYMTNDEHDELEKAFAFFNLELIDDKQLANVVRFLGHSPTDDELQSLANRIGGENWKKFSFSKFLEFIAPLMKITKTHEELFKGDSILCLQCNKGNKKYVKAKSLESHSEDVQRKKKEEISFDTLF
ncbi:calmodulin-like [Ananas comosus]|uniref:Calmodulin-like n=1 Tax=Ananas comosus TaxID=4615 RepID=A0A6P5GDS9_ANACO|nr:calmodulin-like [Ananas comosus]